MSRGRLEPPDLDDRKWQDIVDQTRSLIPRYAPEWTDHNPTDLGISLLELFAWLVEGLIYRLNRVPEKNFIEFLNLLGITRDPATPASTYLTYRASASVLLPKGAQAATPQQDVEPPIIFETDQDLQVLPINLTTALYIRKVVFNKYINVSKHLVASPLDGAQITVPAANSVTIALGFDQPIALPMELLLRFLHPAKVGDVSVMWVYSRGVLFPSAWPAIPGWVDDTASLTKNGKAVFTIPLDWAAQNPAVEWVAGPLGAFPDSLADEVKQPLYWVGLRITNPSATVPATVWFESILFNSVRAINALTVAPPGETLGASDGKPFQVFSLAHQPVFKRTGVPDPYGHLVIEIREPQVGGGFGPWTQWSQKEFFEKGAGTVYRLEPVTGTVMFGDYDPLHPDGHGSIPPAGSEIRAQTYRFTVGGVKGNVGPGTVTVLRTPPPAGIIAVRNPGPGTGGSDEEPIEEAKRRAPEMLRNRNRAVTVEDYEYLAGEATTDVRKVRCLPPRLFTTYDTLPPGVSIGDPWTYATLVRDAGNVHVLVLPDSQLTNATPMPSAEMLEEVSDYLEERRVVTSMLHVAGPRYLPIKAVVALTVWRKAVDLGLVPDPGLSNQYRDSIVQKIDQFFHPILGRADGLGWEIGQDATIAELFEFIRPDAEIGFISAITIQAQTPLYQPTNRPIPIVGPGVWVQLADYEIVCSSGTHSVVVTKA